MSVLYFPLGSVTNERGKAPEMVYINRLTPDMHIGKAPSDCCGALYTGNTNTGENKGIVMWYSDKPEDAVEEDYFIDSIKLVNGQYLHIKHNLSEEEPELEAPDEDEEW